MAASSRTGGTFRRYNTVLDIPETRQEFKNFILHRTGEPLYNQEYPKIHVPFPTGKEKEELKSRQGYYRILLQNNVMRSWIHIEENQPENPLPRIERLPRQLRLFSSEQQQQFLSMEIFYDECIRQTQDQPRFIVVLPVFVSEMKEPTMKGVLLCTSAVAFAVDFSDHLCVDVFKKLLMKRNLTKFFINAEKELQYYWSQLDVAPINVACITTGALRIMEDLHIDTNGLWLELRNSPYRIFPFELFYKVNLESTAAAGYGTRGMREPGLLVTGVKTINLLKVLLAGVQYVDLQEGETWRSVFKYDRYRSIYDIDAKGILTDALGLNFWKGVDQALSCGMKADVFAFCLMYKNFGWSENNERDAGFTSCEFLYNTVMGVMNDPVSFVTLSGLENPDYKVDAANMDVLHFKFLLANVLLKRMYLISNTKIGTLGEMLRRVRFFVPCLLGCTTHQC